MFAIVVAPIYIPTNSVQGFHFLNVLANICYLWSFCLFVLIYLFLAVLGLRCCVRAFSSRSERGLPFVAVHGLIVVASLVVEHGL